ncbi:unnamed protein product [Caenorhabditis angaria]|uniref:Serpentine receptor class gamma n=1 Tax=Caenorhabditis angaria TaxID=860376 RepID=A0A9P1IR30_9PELO|nr:unnamed protein product [Caenorhabditis angaria]
MLINRKSIDKSTTPRDNSVTTHRNEWSIVNSAVYIALDALVIFSSIFYICILISVRSITRSSNFMKTRPEKVIIYQTLILIIVKLLFIPLLIWLFFYDEVGYDDSFYEIINTIYYSSFFIDILTTPIVFQITYIFCNKTNLEVLKKMNFRKLKTWSIVCCGYTSSNSVDQSHSNLYILSEGSTRN